jgi:lipopolysaccharide/colanic/teichoic acid biosynthesis glycosyltransferase
MINSKAIKGGLSPMFQRLVALLGLIVMSPVLTLVAVLIRLESPGNPIFSQTRVGLNGRRFAFYKFRSMRVATDPKYVDVTAMQSDRDGVCQKFFNDPRVTRIGRIIRKYSIDELPQLLNVVKGDMLLIGPRPALVPETDQYSMNARQRLAAMPGLTGLWQVSGRADTTFEEQVALDIRYVREKSWIEDLRILLATVPVVLFGKGAY